jgi:hypothetical protein
MEQNEKHSVETFIRSGLLMVGQHGRSEGQTQAHYTKCCSYCCTTTVRLTLRYRITTTTRREEKEDRASEGRGGAVGMEQQEHQASPYLIDRLLSPASLSSLTQGRGLGRILCAGMRI